MANTYLTIFYLSVLLPRRVDRPCRETGKEGGGGGKATLVHMFCSYGHGVRCTGQHHSYVCMKRGKAAQRRLAVIQHSVLNTTTTITTTTTCYPLLQLLLL